MLVLESLKKLTIKMEKMSERMDKLMSTMVSENTKVDSKLNFIKEKLEKIVENHRGDNNSDGGGEVVSPLTEVKKSSIESNTEINITLLNTALASWISQTKQGDYY